MQNNTSGFLLDPAQNDPLSNWTNHPHTINGSSVIHHIITKWHKHWTLDKDYLMASVEKLIAIIEVRQAKTGSKQVCA